jgi:hypothetical protein
MYYKEFLRVRNLFAGFAICITAFAVFLFLVGSHAHAKVDVNPAPAYTLASQDDGTSAKATFGPSVSGPGIEISSDAGSKFPFSALLAIGGFVAAIFGTVLGTCLAAENCGHLEVAWTRPASRLSYAARLMLVDAAGILSFFAFFVLVEVAWVYACGWQQRIDVDARIAPVLARFVLYDFAWFATIAALTASVRAKAGAIAGFSWVVAFILIVLPSLGLPPVLSAIVQGLDYLNPMMYGSYSMGAEASRHIMQLSVPLSMLGLSAITVLGISAALAQWRRLEA